MKILITAGGTRVPIDNVRHVGNSSSGAYGSSLVSAFHWSKTASNIILFIEKHSPFSNTIYTKNLAEVEVIKYDDYFDYLTVKDIIKREQPDVIVSAAAVSDYILDKTEGKISSDKDEINITLRKGEKVIQSFRELAPKALIFGFKLLSSPTEEEKMAAITKQLKYVDYVVYNDIGQLRKGETARYVYDKHLTPYKAISPASLRDYIKAEYRNTIN